VRQVMTLSRQAADRALGEDLAALLAKRRTAAGAASATHALARGDQGQGSAAAPDEAGAVGAAAAAAQAAAAAARALCREAVHKVAGLVGGAGGKGCVGASACAWLLPVDIPNGRQSAP